MSVWTILEEYYRLPSGIVVEVGYYGNNKFGINGFKEAAKWEDLPHFHNKYVFDKDIYAFDVMLSPISTSHPNLVEYFWINLYQSIIESVKETVI